MLARVSDISTAHEGIRASYDEQKESIECNLREFSNQGITFIILDDVITLGTSMNVCTDILLENGVERQYIIRMAIAKTLGD